MDGVASTLQLADVKRNDVTHVWYKLSQLEINHDDVCCIHRQRLGIPIRNGTLRDVFRWVVCFQ
jgi:hypothetical protein